MITLKKAIKMLEAEYERAKKLEWVHNPLAYALYQVWKKADERRVSAATMCEFCGSEIPEGRQVCPVCERHYSHGV